MTDPVTTPIVVNATPTADQVAAALRQGALALGGIFAALGYSDLLDSDRLNQLAQFAGPAAVIISFVWGQFATRSKAKKLAVTAAAAPNHVAQVK